MTAGLLALGRGDEPWALLLDGRTEDLLRALPNLPAGWLPSDPADRDPVRTLLASLEACLARRQAPVRRAWRCAARASR